MQPPTVPCGTHLYKEGWDRLGVRRAQGHRQEGGQTDSGPGRSPPAQRERTEEETEERHQNSHTLNTDVDGDKTGWQREGPNPPG